MGNFESISSASPLSRRLILIGASNLTFSFPLIAHSIAHSFPKPVDLFAVHGHGRSFCNWSYVLNRGLPPVTECGLWDALAQQPLMADQTWGLITDTGNDLIYGVQVENVLRQVREVFERLMHLTNRITFVRLPLGSIMKLTELNYRIIKKMLFPGPTVPWPEMSARVTEFNERVTLLAEEFGAVILTPHAHWYGIDPIHIRRSQRPAAWQEILETWSFPERPALVSPDLPLALRIWRAPPAERSYWKKPYLNTQPSFQLYGGSQLWQY